MNGTTKVFYVLAAIFAIVFVPYFGAYYHSNGIFDKDYFDFPPTKVEHEYNNFSYPVFYAVIVVAIITLTLYIFPKLFGFKKVKAVIEQRPDKVSFPKWFWIGGLVWIAVFAYLTTVPSGPNWLLHWAYIPLFWGFAFMLDGLIYKRTGGKSIVNNAPKELIGIGVASVAGWLLFEYLNFFVLEYWYYPFGNKVPGAEFYTYAIFASSALMPLSFQWYSLFNTFPNFVNKYKFGPKIRLSRKVKWILFSIAIIALFFMPILPAYFAPIIWLSPLIILAVALELIGLWTPFTPIAKGNWTPVLFTALTYLVEGFLMEGQNYFSAHHQGLEAITNYPGYWMYNVPFVNKYHVFEMPVVGFYGYLPFGIYCLVWWVAFAYLLDIPTDFAKYESPVY